jgi:leader peptidase (prepilin peptidase)/N-methyltransferase
MIRIFGTIFAGLLGLAFGSFLNVCLSRWPQGESVVQPRSHCRHCSHTLAWWENIPLLSWLALRGRCRGCHAWIEWRYPLVEAAIGILWICASWSAIASLAYAINYAEGPMKDVFLDLSQAIPLMLFYWLLVALAVLDAENLWLPDWITLPGIALGFAFKILDLVLLAHFGGYDVFENEFGAYVAVFHWLLGILAAAALILLIRWLYWLVRRREGIGLGDAKLMALLAAWLGFPGALLAFCLGAVLGAVFALVQLALPATRNQSERWAASKLPLGTFLCIGGIISSLCGQQIINAYLRWAGF